MDIYDQVRAALAADGWKNDLDEAARWEKKFPNPRGGAFAARGLNVVLMLDDMGRYLERVDGWGNVDRDVDLRNFPNNPAGAIAAVLE